MAPGAKLVVATERARGAERVARQAAVDIREAWAAMLGPKKMDALEEGLRDLRAALWG